jgi:endonuclease/exonuclease/phosphatase family metal-dependent hydrolase
VPTPVQALIFDCDGTLADTMPLHWRAWETVLLNRVVGIARENHGKLPMAIATGGLRRTIEQVLDHLEIRHLFDAIVTSGVALSESAFRMFPLAGQLGFRTRVGGKWRLLCWLLLILGWGPAGAAVSELKVMSFNIWGQGGQSLGRCIEAIRESGADVVGLQECNAETAQTIAASLGWHHLGAAGTSIVSRYPILTAIPVGGSSGAAIELGPGQQVYLFNCHLPAYPYGPYSMREGQSQEFVLAEEEQTRMPLLNQTLNAMVPYIAASVPCFLTGDFNAPSHLDYADYPWPTSLATYAAGLRDAYREAHPELRTYPPAFAFDDPGITWTPLVEEEPNDAFDRIDFVHYSAGDGVTVLESYELDGRNSANPWPSDHRAVLATFALTLPVAEARATLPSPADGATNVMATPTLAWLPGTNVLSHDVYFGTNPPGTFRTNLTTATLAVGPLDPGTTHYWRIDERTDTGVVTGDVWSFATRPAQYYEWRFVEGDLASTVGQGILAHADAATANLTTFGVADGLIVPLMNGQPARYLHAPGFTATGSGYLASFTQTGPNGGGVYLNEFTLIWDLLVPAPLGWVPLFNTNPENANDADLYLDASGRVGIGAIGHSPVETIQPNRWHRVAFVADLAAGSVRYHVDGQMVFAGSAALDGRHSLYSNVDPGPDLLLFNEGDTSGVYTHEVYLGSFFCVDRALSVEELQSLGGPIAEGVAVGLQPIRLEAERGGTGLVLRWTGGGGYYQLQRRLNGVMNSWEEIGARGVATSAVIEVHDDAAFYRVVAR